jgi:hypothetical protein
VPLGVVPGDEVLQPLKSKWSIQGRSAAALPLMLLLKLIFDASLLGISLQIPGCVLHCAMVDVLLF